MKSVTLVGMIEKNIVVIRGQRVLLSPQLARMYGVQVKVLVQAVKRNNERFPDDFMFQLTDAEYEILKSQIVTSSWGGPRRANPYAFTEQGVSMLSSVLNSRQAIQVNILIMRAFVNLRELLSSHQDLARKLTELEKKYDVQFRSVFEAIRSLMEPPTAGKPGPKTIEGFKPVK